MAEGVGNQLFQDVFANGPVDCSALAASESYSPSEDGPVVRADANGGADFYATANHILANYEAVAARYIAGACIFLAGCADAAAAAPAASGKWIAAGNADRPAEVAAAGDVTADHVRCGVGILLAGKTNYWKTNHHTGGARFSGYMAKVCTKLGIDTSRDSTCNLIWRACHWADTRVILAALGIKLPLGDAAQAKVDNVKRVLAVPEDVALRLRSNPAGTAAWHDIWVGLTAYEDSAAFSNIRVGMGRTRASAVAIADELAAGNPAYHIGAQYLCGRPRIVIPAWSTEVVSLVFTALKFYGTNNTLLRAAVFKNASENPGYSRIFAAVAEAEAKQATKLPTDLGLMWVADEVEGGAHAGAEAEF